MLFQNTAKLIFYFAGQSSPQISFEKKLETLRSNHGCKIFRHYFRTKNSNKFLNATSSEMYGRNIKNKFINS